MCRMRSRVSEDSLVGSTTRSSSASPVGAAAAGASSTGAEGEAVEEDLTAVYGNLREEAGLRGGNPSREAAAGRWRGDEGKSEPRWGWERSKGAEADGAAIWPGRRRARGGCGGAFPSGLVSGTLPRLELDIVRLNHGTAAYLADCEFSLFLWTTLCRDRPSTSPRPSSLTLATPVQRQPRHTEKFSITSFILPSKKTDFKPGQTIFKAKTTIF